MEGGTFGQFPVERPWQGDLCQFFTRGVVARFCLQQLSFPKNPLAIRLLEPAAGHGAFFLPLIPKLVRGCRKAKQSFSLLRPVIRAYEIDPDVAAALRDNCVKALIANDVPSATAHQLARHWIRDSDFLEASIRTRFTHIVGNPPYIRWDAIPVRLRDTYKGRFTSFKQRADLYVAFIERSLSMLAADGQLAFLCPGTWTRNVYGGSIREAFTTQGHLKTVIDLSDVDSFEQSADAYPCFFVFRNGRNGATNILSMGGRDKLRPVGAQVRRHFKPSSAPLLLSRADDMAGVVQRARAKFPMLEEAGCSVRVGSATGCNDVFLGSSRTLRVERSRLLPFVNARSIRDAKAEWGGTSIVNVFDEDGKTVKSKDYPRLFAYLRKHKDALKSRAKASQSKVWWRSIDVLHPDWYQAPKLLVVDISAIPVIGLDEKGYCAGSGVYQIKSEDWPLQDLLVLLSAGILGLFVSAFSTGAAKGFHRFQKRQIGTVPLPRWETLDANWRAQFRGAHQAGNLTSVIDIVADLYECDRRLLSTNLARDWESLGIRQRK
jgi:adenine-specific DNA-methyltransferase